MLNLFPDDYNLARLGRKTAHVLEGPRVFPLGRPETLNAEGLASREIALTRIEIKPVALLDPTDAEACGFATFAAFQTAFIERHPDLTPDSTVSVLHFKLTDR